MRAVVQTRYGPPEVLQVRDVDKPTPRDGELLIKVAASTVTSGDSHMRGFTGIGPGFWIPARLMFGITRPRRPIPGMTLAGTVEAVGRDVTRYDVGDRVFGMAGLTLGTHAEYVRLRQTATLARTPDSLTDAQAAAIPFGSLSALHFLCLAKLQAGQHVLIHGASGAVGCAAVQLARGLGAAVTGVCSARNAQLVRSLGAGRVIDYTTEDFTAGNERYDIIFDTVGKTTFSRCRRVLKDGGRYIPLMMGLSEVGLMLWTSMFGRRKVVCGIAPDKPEALAEIVQRIDAGEYQPVIDRTYSLDQIADAHRHVDAGHKVGSVVLTLDRKSVV